MFISLKVVTWSHSPIDKCIKGGNLNLKLNDLININSFKSNNNLSNYNWNWICITN